MFIHFVQSAFSWLFQHNSCQVDSQVRLLKHDVALIVLGGYCSHVALCSWHVQSLGTSHCNNRISISPPWRRKDGTPSCQAWLEVGKKEGWLIPVTYITVVLVASLLAAT